MSVKNIATFHGGEHDRVVEEHSPDFPVDLVHGSTYAVKNEHGEDRGHYSDRDRAIDAARSGAGLDKK